MTFEEFKRTKETRKRLLETRKQIFISSGFRLFQIAIGICVWGYALAAICMDWYYWPQVHLFNHEFFSTALLLFFWFWHQYYRVDYLILGAVASGGFLGSFSHFIFDDFHVMRLLAECIITVMAFTLYTKMKHPVFSPKYKE